MKNTLLSLSVLLTLAACGTRETEQQVFSSVLQSVQGLGGSAPSSPTVAEIRQRLTPEVRAEFGNAPLLIARLEKKKLASVLVQSATNLDVATYSTPGGVSVFLKQGVVVGTRGLGFDLMTADVSDVLRALVSGGRAVRIHRYLDGKNQLLINSFVCEYTGTSNIVETCYGEGRRFKNTYRISSGRITSSRQWVSPEVGYITLEPS